MVIVYKEGMGVTNRPMPVAVVMGLGPFATLMCMLVVFVVNVLMGMKRGAMFMVEFIDVFIGPHQRGKCGKGQDTQTKDEAGRFETHGNSKLPRDGIGQQPTRVIAGRRVKPTA